MDNLRYKFPRTFHFDFSESLQNDDRKIKDCSVFSGKNLVITEKCDGENTTISSDYIHARSLDSKDHLSRHWIKSLHASIKHEIPKGWRICGENLFALHSVYYTELPSYFCVFAIFNENNICLDWDTTVEWAKLLGLEVVPVLYVGPWNKEKVKTCYTGKSKFEGWTPKSEISFPEFRQRILKNGIVEEFAEETQEGYVCRILDAFPYEDYSGCTAKFVRKGHVQTSDFWMNEIVIPNKLSPKNENKLE